MTGQARIATWNIHGGVGAEGRFDLRRVADVLDAASPDIVALQEVDARRGLTDDRDAFEYLRLRLGSHGADARSIVTPDGDYGQLVISRWPIGKFHIHDLSIEKREPRRLIELDIESPHGPLRFLATHLGLAFGERRRQAEFISAIAGKPAGTVILAGDFNDWLWRGRVHNAIQRVLPARTWVRTFPSRFPLIRLDRIMARPASAVLNSWTVPQARTLSDHLPVFADVRITQ